MFNLGRFLAPFRRKSLTPYEIALDALARGRFAEALERLDELLSDGSLAREQRAAMTNKRGVALVSLQRPEDARRAFEAALEIKPRFAPALVNIGNLLLESGELEAAVAQYEAAIAADDRYAPAHHNLAVAYKRLGRTADSVRALRRAHKLLH
ncbi:MAG TPA: tetratricopeptide repeat protein [Candidatus Rubrimentiphilum sp.]|nr:tetratricopeptide repeat protein [Candidatus Rubrimentiphilum sp.]